MPSGYAEELVRQSFYKWSNDKKEVGNTNLKSENSLEVKQKKPAESAKKCEQNPIFSKSDSYNGAVYDNYSWSQSLLEVDILVNLPQNVTAKGLDVTIHSNHISVKLKDNGTIFEGELCEKCRQNEAIWSVQNNVLNIHLDKVKEKWWNRLIVTEPKLDLATLDCSRPFEELSDEAQAKIAELQWNQDRKRLGLPTSEQIAMQDVLKKAWNSEGSPFTGPFDPNVLN